MMSRAAAIWGLVSTLSATEPGVEVSSATAVSLVPNTRVAHSAASMSRGSTPLPQRAASTILRKPASPAALGRAQRVGSTKWVWTSITGAWPENAAAAASSSVSVSSSRGK